MRKIKAPHIMLFGLLLIAAFLLGFLGGQVSVMRVNDEHVVLIAPRDFAQYTQHLRVSTELESPSNKPDNSISSKKDINPLSQTAIYADNNTNHTNSSTHAKFEALISDPNASDLLSFLIDIASSENTDDMQFFARTMDQLRNLVSEDPAATQALIDRFLLSGVDDKTPYYVISVLQGADIPNRELLFENLAQQLHANNSNSAQVKLLHLISSTGMQESNQNISNMLTDIALYSDIDTSNRLYALDLLMPYQLEANQKLNIVNDLKTNINNMEESQRSYAIENMMRFSEPSNREDMAREFLGTYNDLSTRVAVLSSLHSGTIKPSANLKEQLFSIAINSGDPLSSHAKHALTHVFDIDKSEYDQLNNAQ